MLIKKKENQIEKLDHKLRHKSPQNNQDAGGPVAGDHRAVRGPRRRPGCFSSARQETTENADHPTNEQEAHSEQQQRLVYDHTTDITDNRKDLSTNSTQISQQCSHSIGIRRQKNHLSN